MNIENQLSDDVVLGELGRRIARVRLERDLTQQQLADQAGVNRKAVVSIESGQPVQLVTFVRVLRALELLDALDVAVPQPGPSPIELLQMRGRERRRASGRGAADVEPDRQRPWRWGDQS